MSDSAVHSREVVILLHGLCRTHRSMEPLAEALRRKGYHVVNVDYPSRAHSVRELADVHLGGALASEEVAGAEKVHFVTHSMGGILVRSYLARHALPKLGRVVMLGPPNQGSEVVDQLGGWKLFTLLNGPAGKELGTEATSTPNTLGPVTFETGVIAGNRSINWINSLMIRGADDGKVSVERTKVAGMKAHLIVPVSHPFLMRREAVIREVLSFLESGVFLQN